MRIEKIATAEHTETITKRRDHRDRRVPIDSMRPAGKAGPGGRVRGSENKPPENQCGLFSDPLTLPAAASRRRIESLGDLCPSSARSAIKSCQFSSCPPWWRCHLSVLYRTNG